MSSLAGVRFISVDELKRRKAAKEKANTESQSNISDFKKNSNSSKGGNISARDSFVGGKSRSHLPSRPDPRAKWMCDAVARRIGKDDNDDRLKITLVPKEKEEDKTKRKHKRKRKHKHKKKRKRHKKKHKHKKRRRYSDSSSDNYSDSDDESAHERWKVANDVVSDERLPIKTPSVATTTAATISSSSARMSWMNPDFEAGLTAVSSAPTASNENTRQFAGRDWTVAQTGGDADKNGKNNGDLGPTFGYGLYTRNNDATGGSTGGGTTSISASTHGRSTSGGEREKKRGGEREKKRERGPAQNNKNVDLNALAAKALRAQMLGDLASATAIEEEIKRIKQQRQEQQVGPQGPQEKEIKRKAEKNKDDNIVHVPLDENGRPLPSLLSAAPLTRADMRSGRRRGMLTRAEQDNRESNNDGKQRESQLYREFQEERMQGAEDMDKNFVRNVLKMGKRFNMSEHLGIDENTGAVGSRNGGATAADEKATSKLFAPKSEAMTARRRQEIDAKRAASAARGFVLAEQRCAKCIKSEVFKRRWKHLLLALGEHTYLTLAPGADALTEGHCRIVPLQHAPGLTSCDEMTQREVSQFKRSLERYNASLKPPKALIYLERAKGRRGGHTALEAIPVPVEVAADAAIYFRKALLDECGNVGSGGGFGEGMEGGSGGHAVRLIDTAVKPLVRSVPSGMPYFHAEWAGGGTAFRRGGIAHPMGGGIDGGAGSSGGSWRGRGRGGRGGREKGRIPLTFGLDLVSSMLGHMGGVAFGRRARERATKGQKGFLREQKRVQSFSLAFQKFDWTTALDGGSY